MISRKLAYPVEGGTTSFERIGLISTVSFDCIDCAECRADRLGAVFSDRQLHGYVTAIDSKNGTGSSTRISTKRK
jgi:hypothetical protein